MKELVPFLKALCEEVRLRIIKMLMEREMCVCEIMDGLKLSQPAVSHHMKILKQAGLVQDRRQGKWVYYSLDKEFFSTLEKQLGEKLFVPISESTCDEAAPVLEQCK